MLFLSTRLACLLVIVMISGPLPAAEPSATTASERPDFRVMDKWRGTWEVTVQRHQPQPSAVVTYTETFAWELGQRFLRAQTSGRSEGNDTMSMFWFDIFTKRYRYVIFDAAGYGLELPPPTWDEATQTMDWRTGLFAPIDYTGQTRFVDPDHIDWSSELKDWKGTVILKLQGTSKRLR